MDLHGRRIALRAMKAWRAAGKRLKQKVPVDVRWTRVVLLRPGGRARVTRVSAEPVWGLPFLGGSEDGASIFHEPGSTEGKRLPKDAADPVHGRKIRAAPGIVHEATPEVHLIRVGDRVLLGDAGRAERRDGPPPRGGRGRRTCRPGVKEPVVIGLANDYMGYLTTPEEYEMQHYEGGHTVFGIYTSILAKNSFVDAHARDEDGAARSAARRAGRRWEHRPGRALRRRR